MDRNQETSKSLSGPLDVVRGLTNWDGMASLLGTSSNQFATILMILVLAAMFVAVVAYIVGAVERSLSDKLRYKNYAERIKLIRKIHQNAAKSKSHKRR